VLAHRVILKPESRLRKRTPSTVVAEILGDTSIPVLKEAEALKKDYF